MALVKVLAALNSPDRPGCDRMGIMEDNGNVFFFSVPWSSYMWAMVIPGFAHLEKTHTIPYR
jgi:hypothetical protein